MEDPHVLDDTVQNLVALVAWLSRFVHAWCKSISVSC